MVKVCFNQ